MKFIYLIALGLLLTGCGGSSSGGGSKELGSSQSETSAFNDTIATAQTTSANAQITGSLIEGTDIEDFYKFSITQQTTINIRLEGPQGTDFDITLVNSNGTNIGISWGESSSELITKSLATGVYYVVVDTVEGSGTYTLTLSTTSGQTPASGVTTTVAHNDTSFCIQVDNLTDAQASELVNNNTEGTNYQYGSCTGSYIAKCEQDVENATFTTYFASSYSFSSAIQACAGTEGRFTAL